jgi:hypothetical protein
MPPIIATVLIAIAVINIGFTALCGYLSKQRGHGWLVGLLLGFFLGILGLIIILVMTPVRSGRRPRRTLRRGAIPARGRNGLANTRRRTDARRRPGVRTTEHYPR